MAGGYTYSVTFQNQSTQSGAVCLYQTGAGLSSSAPVFSVAWMTKTIAPTTKVVFQWEVAFDFVWAETGPVGEGAMMTASQTWRASAGNQVTLTKTAGYYSFTNQAAGPTPGSLYLNQDKTIPANMAAAGIGMSGAATLVVQAQPNINLIFAPQPAYFIAFGNYTTGQMLDPAKVTNAASVVFPINVFSMAATLQADNTWKIESLAAMNAAHAVGLAIE